MTGDVWDLAVVGSGIAGLTAARTAAEHGLRTLALDRLAPGGQLINIGALSGYPGLPDATTGPDLAGTLLTDAMTAGVEIDYTEVTTVRAGPPLALETLGDPVTARAVVVATGLGPGRLDVRGADSWAGRGLSECASCDGPLFAGRAVAVVGDDEWAAQEAVELAGVAGSVTVVVPGEPRWSAHADARLGGAGVSVRTRAVVAGLDGDGTLTGVLLTDGTRIDAAGVFVQIGRSPRSEVAAGMLDRSPDRRVTGDPAAGVFAAGDVRSGSVDRLVAAAADGVHVGLGVVRYLERK